MDKNSFYYPLLLVQLAGLGFAIAGHQWVAVCPWVGFIFASYNWHTLQKAVKQKTGEARIMRLGQQRLWQQYKSLLSQRIPSVMLLTLLLASCAHPNQPQPPKSEPIGADAVPRADSLVLAPAKVDSMVVESHRSLLDKVLGRTPTKTRVHVADNHVGNIGKKSTVSIFYGPATQSNTTVGKKATAAVGDEATATVTGKKSGPAVIASDSATLNNAGAGGNLATVNGDGNTLEQTAVPPAPEPSLLDKLKSFGKILAWGIGIGVVGLVLYEFAWPLLLGWFRRSKSNSNQA